MSHRVIFERSKGQTEVVDLHTATELVAATSELLGRPSEFDFSYLEAGLQRVFAANKNSTYPSVIERYDVLTGKSQGLTDLDIDKYHTYQATITESECAISVTATISFQLMRKVLQDRIDFATEGKGVLNETHRLAVLDTCEALMLQLPKMQALAGSESKVEVERLMKS